MMDAVCPKCSKSNGPLHFIMGLDYGPDFDFCCTSCREELAMEAKAARFKKLCPAHKAIDLDNDVETRASKVIDLGLGDNSPGDAKPCPELNLGLDSSGLPGDAKPTPLRKLKRFRINADGVAATCDEPSCFRQ